MSDEILRAADAIDDCWNRIGIRGDQTCDRLPEHIHCRNCDVYARGASWLLDRIPVTLEAQPALVLHPAREHAREGEPVLLFRVADEWFALPARFVHQVAETGAIHSLPKVRSKAVLGLANIRGQLTVCVSLMRLLDLAEAALPDTQSAGATRATARFLVTRDAAPDRGREKRADDMTVFPVDEVHGIVRMARDELRAVPATLAHAAAFYTRAIMDWQGHSVGVLDSALLFETLRRSLG